MKKTGVIISTALAVTMAAQSASACTTIYAGSAKTADGSTIFARSEDYSNSQNKLYNVIPAGLHKEGEVYDGCYGFQWTYTHDSYGYNAFRDDNGLGVCPDCGGTHVHSPYEAAGTNEKGVTVTCTETLGASEVAEAADPYEDAGIEEAEMVTVLLGEASTAKEAVDLILSIYDSVGANAGSGITIADANESWYIENVTGHQYIALKLNSDTVFVEPNMSVIGKIDLDDTENVIASADLIKAAQDGGFFVGDAEENVIDYIASYNADQTANARIKDALTYLVPELYSDIETEPDVSLYALSNVAEDGSIVQVNTGIAVAKALTIEDVQNFYKIPTIGYARNLETHIFQIADESAAGTVEWIAMDDASSNVFVPYFPMLTTDVDASYKVSTEEAAFTEEKPEAGFNFPATVNQWVNEERVAVDGYMTLPEGWEESYYWTMDALTNLVSSGVLTDAQVADVKDTLAAKQAEVNEQFTALTEEVKAAADQDAASVLATEWSMKTAQDVKATAAELVASVSGAEEEITEASTESVAE